MRKQYFLYLLAAVLIAIMPSCSKTPNYKVLIITGQSNHNWKVSSEAIKQILDETGMFSSTILTTPRKGEDMLGFNPDFSKYDLVVLDYEGDIWPEPTNDALTDYVNHGGGLLMYNSKSDLGGAVYDSVTLSKRQDFEIRSVISDHPVTNGLPVRWLHPADIIVQGLKPAGEDSQVLAAAFIGNEFRGPRKREPVLLTRNLGEGRIFTTLLGTPDDNENMALHCTGFIVTLQRGAEWAATGEVTQEVPFDFPTAAGTVLRSDFKTITTDDLFDNIGNYDITRSTKYFTYLQSQIRKAGGDEKKLLELEKKMVGVLKDDQATNEAKKLILRELSWMGTDYCIPSVKKLASNQELTDDVEFALERLQK
jgi:type 1 glutamine amidotransferase